MKELSEIGQDVYGYHFTCEWSGSGKIEMELVEARDRCGVRSVDVNWSLAQSENNWTAGVGGADLTKVKKVQDYLIMNGWFYRGYGIDPKPMQHKNGRWLAQGVIVSRETGEGGTGEHRGKIVSGSEDPTYASEEEATQAFIELAKRRIDSFPR